MSQLTHGEGLVEDAPVCLTGYNPPCNPYCNIMLFTGGYYPIPHSQPESETHQKLAVHV